MAADSIARDTAALERMEAAADTQAGLGCDFMGTEAIKRAGSH